MESTFLGNNLLHRHGCTSSFYTVTFLLDRSYFCNLRVCQRPWHKLQQGVIDHTEKIIMTIRSGKYLVLLLNSLFHAVQMAAITRKLMPFLGSISDLRRIKWNPALTKREGFFFPPSRRFCVNASECHNDPRFHKSLVKSQSVNQGHITSLAQQWNSVSFH